MNWEHELYNNEHKTKSSQHYDNYAGHVVSQSEQNTPRRKFSCRNTNILNLHILLYCVRCPHICFLI